jgi:hypothetical protein
VNLVRRVEELAKECGVMLQEKGVNVELDIKDFEADIWIDTRGLKKDR